MSTDAGSSPWASSAWSWYQVFLQGALFLALGNDAREQDLRLECWSPQSLTSNRADAPVHTPARACVLGVRRALQDSPRCSNYEHALHCGGSGSIQWSQRELSQHSHGFTVKERDTQQNMGSPRGRAKVRVGGSPSTEDCSWGCLHASVSAFGHSFLYLHPASPLAS